MKCDVPNLPVVVTGDAGLIVTPLAEHGLMAPRVVHEESATLTVENAKCIEVEHARISMVPDGAFGTSLKIRLIREMMGFQ